MENELIGKTFDDFLMSPQHAISRRSDINDFSTRFSQNITLNFPIVSANMDTVTESRMAIEMARFGGIGIIHRGMSIERQAEEVAKVKRAENFIIKDPYMIYGRRTIAEAEKLMQQKSVNALVVVDKDKKLWGILTKRDIKFLTEEEKENMIVFYRMTSHIKSSYQNPNKRDFICHTGNNISQEEAVRLFKKHRVEKIPLVNNKNDVVGLITSKDIEKLIIHPFANKDANGRLRVGAAIGVKGDFIERASALIKAGVDVIVMDIAHGDSMPMKDGVQSFRKYFGNFELMAGNIATSNGALLLKNLGVNGIKAGIGSGSGCRTRLETGAGVGQVEAIRSAYLAAGNLPIIADGGVKYGKDIWMALAFGANSVMLGSMLSGTDESPGRLIEDPRTGEKLKIYRGMTSPEVKTASEEAADIHISHVEGQETKVPYRGSVISILEKIKGNLQSSISYVGENSLKTARSKTSMDPLTFFTLISEATRRESYER